MQGFEDSEFSRFLEQSQQQESTAETLAFTQLKMRTFLEQRGVEFELEQYETLWYEDEEQRENHLWAKILEESRIVERELSDDELERVQKDWLEELQVEINAVSAKRTRVSTNRMMLFAISAHKEMVNLSHDEVGKALIKKELQAQLFIEGYGATWIELIDAEFEGESFDQDDFEFIALVAQKLFSTHEKNSDYLKSILAKSRNYLQKSGIKSLTNREEIALRQLTLIIALHPEDQPRALIAERLNLILLQHELTTPAWRSMVDSFLSNNE